MAFQLRSPASRRYSWEFVNIRTGSAPEDQDGDSRLPGARARERPKLNDFVWVATSIHHQVMKFTRDGEFIQEQVIRPAAASTFNVAFSPGPEQELLYVAEVDPGRRFQKFTFHGVVRP